jgi:hypothetical protein
MQIAKMNQPLFSGKTLDARTHHHRNGITKVDLQSAAPVLRCCQQDRWHLRMMCVHVTFTSSSTEKSPVGVTSTFVVMCSGCALSLLAVPMMPWCAKGMWLGSNLQQFEKQFGCVKLLELLVAYSFVVGFGLFSIINNGDMAGVNPAAQGSGTGHAADV